MMLGQLNEPGRRVVRQLRRLDRSHRQGRAAVRQAAAAAGRRAQHRRHAARLDEREAVPARPDRQRSPLSRPSTPTARCTARPSTARDMLPILDPVKNVATTFKAPVRDPEMPLNLGPGHAAALDAAAAVALLGQRAHLGHARQQPQLDVRPRRPAVAGGVGARRRQSGVLQGRARIIRRRRRSRWSAPCATSRCSIRRRRSTRSSTPATRRTTRSSATTPTTRCGRAAAARSSAG